MITDIARGEVDLDTLKAGASLIPVAKITKVPKVVKAIGNVGKTGSKKGKQGEKITKSGQTKQIKARDKGESGRKPKTRSYEDEKYRVGPYNDIKGAKGFDAHHVGQKALMKKFIKGYNPKTAPAINVPKLGHTSRIEENDIGIVSRSLKGVDNARQLLARDIRELRRVYPDIPNSKLRELANLNKKMYSEMRIK